jgi:hypothetical protein
VLAMAGMRQRDDKSSRPCVGLCMKEGDLQGAVRVKRVRARPGREVQITPEKSGVCMPAGVCRPANQ